MHLRLSYTQKIFLFIVGISLATLISTLSVMAYFNYDASKKALIDKAQSITRLIANYAITPLTFDDPKSALATFEMFSNISQLHQIALYDAQDKLFVLYQAVPHTTPILQKRDAVLFEDKELYIYQTIIYKGAYLGTVFVETDLEDFLADFWIKNSYFLVLFLLLAFFVLLASKKVQKALAAPILLLAKVATEIKKQKNYAIRVAGADQSDEIAALYGAFNELLSNLETQEIERETAQEKAQVYRENLEVLAQELESRVELRTSELQESILHLHEAQDKLVESEKMAALGNLVSGVAHEVNTPLGNAVTATSIVVQTSKKITDAINANQVKKSELLDDIGVLAESAQIIQVNINRASDLIKSFKKISIDQQCNDERSFALVAYTNDIFNTFAAVLKKRHIVWEVLAKKELEIFSFPGVYAQILTNLIQNSLAHAFEGKESGSIQVELLKGRKYLTIIYRDDGVGIDESVKKRIYEPFITTKRNQGGSGLGMNIIYNLVTQKLKGSISFESAKNEGSAFTLKFPIVLDATMSENEMEQES